MDSVMQLFLPSRKMFLKLHTPVEKCIYTQQIVVLTLDQVHDTNGEMWNSFDSAPISFPLISAWHRCCGSLPSGFIPAQHDFTIPTKNATHKHSERKHCLAACRKLLLIPQQHRIITTWCMGYNLLSTLNSFSN